MKLSVGIVVSAIAVLLFGGVATSSIAESKKGISKAAKEKAIEHQEKGSKFDDEGDFQNAIVEYKKSLDYDPEDPNTLFNLGVIYLKVNKAPEAEKVFERLSKLLPKDTEVLNLLGVAYSGTGKKSEAVTIWEKSLKIEPEQPKVKDMIAELKTAGNMTAEGKK
jgi:tetratricopeptide (TPR) repeat protein